MKKCIEYLIIFFLIMLSGSVFFKMHYFNISNYSLCILVFIHIIFYRDKITKRNSTIFLTIITAFIFNILINLNKNPNISNIKSFLLVLICLLIIQSNITKKIFISAYINIIAGISIVSLICYFLSFHIPVSRFPLYTYLVNELDNKQIIMYTPYYTFTYVGSKIRNAGVFWEPGAFQCYINLALLFLVNFKDFINSKRKFNSYVIIFVLTLITTYSTTGYIIMFLILFYYFVRSLNYKIPLFYKILFFIIILISTYFIFNSSVIVDKFQNNNDSYSVRLNDTNSSLKLIKENPFVGLGFYSDELKIQQEMLGVYANSNGLLLFTIMFGIPISLLFLYLFFKGIKNFFNTNTFYSIFILCIFLLIFSSEYVNFLPVYLSFLLNWKAFDQIKLNN